MSIKVILTDLDGVIRYFPAQRDGAIEKQVGIPEGAIARVAFAEELLQRVITGEIKDDAWRAGIQSKLAVVFGAARADKAIRLWSESPGELDSEILAVLLKSKIHARLALLTNATDRLDSDLSRLGIRNEFDRIFNSSEIGHAKPSAKIFEHVVRELGCAANEILFIDDSKANTAAAQSLGFCVLHFQKGTTDLGAEIKVQCGI